MKVCENGFAQYIQFGRMISLDILFELIMLSVRIFIFLFYERDNGKKLNKAFLFTAFLKTKCGNFWSYNSVQRHT